MLEIRKLSLSIGGARILNGIDLDVHPGEFVALVGPNGSGKSSLVKCVGRIHRKFGGSVQLAGRDITQYAPPEYARRVSLVRQHNGLVEGLTVRDMVAYGRLPHHGIFAAKRSIDQTIISESIAQVGLSEFENRLLSTLSGGELQRVYLASSLCQQPDLLILDEPTNHLDVRHQYQMLELTHRLAAERQMAVLCVLHDIQQASRYADRVVMLKDGKVRAIGKAREICTPPNILDVFGMHTRVHGGVAGSVIEFISPEAVNDLADLSDGSGDMHMSRQGSGAK